MYHFDMPPKPSYVHACRGRGRGGRGGAPVLPPPFPAEGAGGRSDEGAEEQRKYGVTNEAPPSTPVGYSVKGSGPVVVGENEKAYREAAQNQLNIAAEPYVSKQIKTAYAKVRRIAAHIDVCDAYVFYETDRDKKVVQEMVVIVAKALRDACDAHSMQNAMDMLVSFGRVVSRRISKQFILHDHYCQKSCQLLSDIQGVAFYLLHCVVFTKPNEFESYEHVIVSLRNCFSYVKFIQC